MCNGQSTAAYPALAAVIGANVPDLRGEFIRGADLGRGVDLGRLLGSYQGDAIRNITGTFYNDGEAGHGQPKKGAFYLAGSYSNGATPKEVDSSWTDIVGFDASREVPTANENRPRNIALLPCIKY